MLSDSNIIDIDSSANCCGNPFTKHQIWSTLVKTITKKPRQQIVEATVMIDNQSFQSLLQLAVAMNIGFAAIATFMGNTLSKEKQKIEALFETSNAVRNLSQERQDALTRSDRDGFNEVSELRNEVTLAESQYDNTFSNYAKWVALGCAVASYALLMFASFDGASQSVWVRWGSVFVNLPFLLFVGYAAYLSVRIVDPLRRKRQELDGRLCRKLQTLTAGGA